MVTSIGGVSATQAAYAPSPKTIAETASSTATPVPAETGPSAPAPTQSTESAASARLGEQLNAQADASRVQRAVDQSTAQAGEAGADEVADTEASGTEASGSQAAGAQAPAGARGASTAASDSADTDYIAEADTNSDKTVSDQERAAYETKLRQQAEESAASARQASGPNDPAEAREAEVRAAYGVDQDAAPALDITA